MSVAKEMQYELQEGGLIQVFGSEVIFIDPDTESTMSLRSGTAKMVRHLLNNPNELVTYDQLYCAYQGHSNASGNVKRDVQNMRDKIPKKIRKSMCNHTNCGYALMIKESTPLLDRISPEGTIPIELFQLSGEYYAFYPGKRENQILGAYIHIQQVDNNMIAHAVLGITDVDDFEKVPSIFTVESDFFSQINYDNFSQVDRRHLFSGKLEKCSTHVVTITLDNIIDCDRWQVVLNIKDFMAHPRETTKDTNFYRGGLGIKLGGWSGEISASRIALVRKSLFIHKYMGLDSRDIKDYLESSNRVFGTEQSDHDFYQWLAGKHPLIDK